MILLSDFRRFVESLAETITEISSTVPLTIEANMADKIGAIAETDGAVLFFLPPSGQATGRPDAFREDSMFVIFVMKKYNPRRTTSYEALEAAHPVAEKVKAALVRASQSPCHFMHIDASTINTMPETEFFGNWAGWSIGFTSK